MSLNSMHICLPCRRRLLLTRNKTLPTSFSSSSSSSSSSSFRSYTRPSFAPKPTIDLRHIRNAPGLYEQNCIDRNYKHQARHSWRILELHNQWLEQQSSSRKLREHNNVLKKQLAHVMSKDPSSPASNDLLDQAKHLKTQLAALDIKENELKDEMDALALELPNLSSTHTPNGHIPHPISYLNPQPPAFTAPSDNTHRSHVDIGHDLDLLDFHASATTSGWGWYFLKNEAALLEHALVQYALSTALSRGWKIVTPPSLVYSHIAHACGFQPRDANGEQQIYTIAQPEKDRGKPSLCLTGTAEIPFAGMKANTVLDASELPLKIIGASRCYRAEAGARGVDTKGLYRVHEFTKVEMFAWTMPDGSSNDVDVDNNDIIDDESHADPHFADAPAASPSQLLFDEMVALQKDILTSLGLHCRVLEMPAADLGASATRKIDIEAFFPSRKDKDEGWGEVTSASMCTDYQSRRLATRVKVGGGAGRKTEWPWTVNGTAMAVPRVLAAIMENGWEEETGSLRIPEVLRPWMGGLERIVRK